ncbi:MAG: PilN domain-containing protein, partial [Candidatus Omnitrophica bacterium]|nr:PilN domain-containing protein [Candidatus Omnitrophota bacterium]
KEKPEYNIALINIDSEYIGIDIMEKEKLVFTRGFSYEGKDSYVGKNAVDEIKKSIATCRKERKLNVDKIFISGAKNRIKVIEPILKEELGIPIDLIEQARNVELDKSIETDLAEASFIELIGLSLKNKDMKINLLPESMIEDNQLRFLKKSLMKTFALLISIILIFSGIIVKKIFDKSRYLLLLNSRIKAIEPKVIKTRRMRENIKIIKNVIRKKPLAIDIITEIYKITPQGITFNLLDYKSDKSLILRGDAPSLDSIIKFISILEKSQYFEDVKIKYTRKRSAAGTQLTDFEIICLLSKVK